MMSLAVDVALGKMLLVRRLGRFGLKSEQKNIILTQVFVIKSAHKSFRRFIVTTVTLLSVSLLSNLSSNSTCHLMPVSLSVSLSQPWRLTHSSVF